MTDDYTHFNDFGEMKSYPKPEIMPKYNYNSFHCFLWHLDLIKNTFVQI